MVPTGAGVALMVVGGVYVGWFLAWKLVLVHIPLVQEISGLHKKHVHPKLATHQFSKYYMAYFIWQSNRHRCTSCCSVSLKWKQVLCRANHNGADSVHKGPKPTAYLKTAKVLADRLLLAFTSGQTPIPFSDGILGDPSAHRGTTSLSKVEGPVPIYIRKTNVESGFRSSLMLYLAWVTANMNILTR